MPLYYRFGKLTLDIDRLELTGPDGVRPLEPKVYSLLVYLIENRDRVVSKDELVDGLWDGRFISDGALNTALSMLRRAVGDTGRDQHTIKTFPRRGFRFIADTVVEKDKGCEASNPAEDSVVPERSSIAVLPFSNLSSDPDQAFFADGTTDEIINLLSLVPGILVIARNSTIRYREQRVNVGTIASELGVRYVLKGSVLKSGNRIRVTAQCVDTQSGSPIWANHFDGDLGDIFAVQDEIATGIVGALQAGLLLAEAAIVKRTPPHALDAWGNLVNARVKLFAYERDDIGRAEPFARQAIAIDPDYGEAHALLCHLLAWRSYNGWCDDPKEVARKSLHHAARALTLSPNNPAVLADVGFARMWIGRPKQCLPFLERSIGINPNSALACAQYGAALAVNGNTKRGIEYCRRAFRLSPNDPMQYFFQFCLAFALQIQGDHKEARAAAEASLQLNPNICWAYTILASSCVQLGELDEARRAIRTVTAMSKTAVSNLFRAWSGGTLWHIHADPILEVYDGPLPKRMNRGQAQYTAKNS